MKKQLVVTILATLFTAGCIRYIDNKTYSEFKHPLPKEIRCCLGDTTLSPEEGKLLSDFELYRCAEILYQEAEIDCSRGSYHLAEKLCDDALLNMDSLSDKRKDTLEYKTLREEIETLHSGITRHNHCR